MSYFTPTSYTLNSVEIADCSRTPIQGIGTATITPTLSLSSLPFTIFFLQLIISKIAKILNCTVIFPTHCVFQEFGTEKVIGTGHEQNELYELELTSDHVACISTSTKLDYYRRLSHASLPTLKLLFSDLSQNFILKM